MSNPSLRPPGSILKVVETFDEARGHLEALSCREIGGVAIKGVARGSRRTYLAKTSELGRFAHEATRATQGSLVGGRFRLEIRHQQPVSSQGHREGVFTADMLMHIDGYFKKQSGKPRSAQQECHPLMNREVYHGVSHHITEQGRLIFVMDQLSNYRIRQLVKGQSRGVFEISDTNDLELPMQGEAVPLEAGDYVAFHAFGVYRQPVFVHGTTDCSENRRSVAYMAPICEL